MDNCKEFEQQWQDLFDRRYPAPLLEETWSSHLRTCAACRELDRRNRKLAIAIESLASLPAPETDVAEKVLRLWQADRGRSLRVRRTGARVWVGALSGLAAAAAVLLVFWIGRGPRPHDRPQLQGPHTIASERPLSETIADATTATLRLALDTSQPAARVGRQILITAVSEVRPSAPFTWPRPARLISVVGDQFFSGVQPLSKSARKAFGFLVPPTEAGQPSSTDGHRDA